MSQTVLLEPSAIVLRSPKSGYSNERGRSNKDEGKWRQTRDRRSFAKSTTIQLIPPPAAEQRVPSEYVHVLASANLVTGWFAYVPSRFGSSAVVDYAIQAVIEGTRYELCNDPAVREAGLRSCARAIHALRRSLVVVNGVEQAEFTLLAMCLLSIFEWSMCHASPTMWAHLKGAAALLAERALQERSPSDLMCAIAYWNWVATFQVPALAGKASPFERSSWLKLDPPSGLSSPRSAGLLRKLSYQLHISLPWLIAMVRDVRCNPTDTELWKKAFERAQELLLLEDAVAESDVLHLVKVRKTEDPADASLFACTFHFVDVATFEAATYYWQTRIFLHRLCMKLAFLTNLPEPRAQRHFWHTENQRMAKNLLMSWPFSYGLGKLGCASLCQGLVAAWGVNVDSGASKLQETTRAWILRRHSDQSGNIMHWSARDMDDAAELLVGGPLQGEMVRQMKLVDEGDS